MLLLVLGMSTNVAWAQIDAIIGSIDVEDPTTWFYVNLNASVSNPGCGTTSPGQVWLLHTEAKPTDKLDNEGKWMCLLDENGYPVPDPQVSGNDPWSTCLHVQDRKATNPWITSIPRPARPENPYTAEYVNILRNLWYTGYDAGKADHEASHEKNYPNDESWSAEKVAVVKDGYDIGFAAQNRENPYYEGIEGQNLITDWDGYFENGLRNAKEGGVKQEPNWPEWGLPRYLATKIAYNAGYDWYHDWYQEGNPEKGHYLNEATPIGAAKPVDFAPSVSLKGTALVYAPGFEDIDAAIAYVSTYAYFFGKVQENDGWYFMGWSYTEGESDLGGVVAGSAENDSIMFRVLPASTNGEANIRNEYVYATFQPVRVSDYKVNGLINGTGNSTTVIFDAVGERVSVEDFTVSCSDADFSAEISSCVNNKVTVTVTYSGSANGEFRGNVTLASKSGCSQLTAAVYARVGADSANEASLYDGKTSTGTSGDLVDMISEADGKDLVVMLNKNYTEDLTINANVTLNFNGYAVQDLTVEGGEVTIAFDKYGSNGEAVSVTSGKLILNGGEFASLAISAGAVVEQNGATITGAATNSGALVTTEGRFEGGLTSAGTLTVNGGAFAGETAIAVTGGTAILNKAAISATTTGILISGGETTISSKFVSVFGGTNAVKQTSGSITLLNGKYDGATPLDGTIGLQGGYFKTNTPGIAIPSEKKVLNVLAGTEFAEGYRYFIGEDATVVGVCRIGTTSYATLEAALAYANNNPSQDVVIIMTNDYTLPAGYYTLPARATLIVPMSDEQETGYEIVNRVSNNSAARLEPIQPYEFRRLTFAKGVNMDVHGTIELTCTQRASDDGYAAMPYGPYGHLVMEEGSHMTLQNGSLLRAWGYMTGKGETDARRGSKVREQFQMGDWKGGGESFKMLDVNTNPGRVFPISQYFIQNIESPVKYHPGAILSTTTSVSANFGNMGITAMANDIIIVGVGGGDPAMFFMDQEADAENTWVRKWYDAERDVQTYDVNTGAHIGSMVLDLGKLGTDPLKMNSGMFVLPITNNMKIHLLSGSMDFTQVTSLLPGAEVEVDKESTVTIYNNPDPEVFSGALIIYDKDQWGEYANGKCIECVWDAKEEKYKDGMETGYYTKVVKYSPSWDGALVAGKPADGKPTVRHEDACPDDASINVHGTFATGEGYLLTTEGGANIFSSNEDAGSYVCSQNPPSSETLEGLYVLPINKTSAAKKLYLAKLKNADETYTETDEAGMNQIFIYRDNAWQAPVKDNVQTFYFDCYTAEVDMAAYAADVAAKANNIAICHAPDNIAECLVGMALAQTQGMSLTPANYETMKANGLLSNYMATIQEQVTSMKAAGYDLGGAVQHIYIKPQEWLEIASQAHIKLNFDQSYIDELKANYEAGNYNDAVNAYMEYVEAQAYNPYLEGVEGNADHTYSDADGAGRLFIKMDGCQWWEVENVNNLYHCIHPNNDTYYYWVDTYFIDPYDEDTEVPGHWEEKRFTITWKNWDGTVITTKNKEGEDVEAYSVTFGTMAEFLGTNPTREPNIDYTYDFAGWSPALGPVTSDVTYTATFTQKPRMYTIIFQNEGGVEIERQFLTHNEMPVCENTPTKVGHTLEWTPAIAAVTGDATYRATWLEEPPTEYAVTFFDYDGTTKLKPTDETPYMVAVGALPTPPADPAGKPASASGEFTYVFDHWAPALEAVSATSAKSYTAVYREEAVTYTVRFFQADGETQIGEDQKLAYGAVPAIPTAGITEPGEAGYTYTYVWENMMDDTKTVEAVKADADYKPRFTGEKIKYTVKLKSNPSEACTFTGAGIYKHGDAITISQTAKPNYTFQNWTDENGQVVNALPTTVTADIDLIANFTFEGTGYTITWNNWNGTQLASGSQKENTATTYVGATPTREASESTTYMFYGWTAASDSKTYKNGLTPKATKNETYTAYFKDTVRTYTISWKNEAGTADIEVDYEQPYGTAIEYNSATPTKNASAEATYAFDGWSETQDGAVVALPATVTGDAAFYAHFAATPKEYLISWVRNDGSLISQSKVAFGETPVAPANPTKAETPQYTYSFTGWTPTIAAVDGNATYTATFSETTKESIELSATGSLDLEEAVTEKKDLIITSTGVNSSELKGADNLTLTGEAIFRMEKYFAAQTWYAVAVPWIVEFSGIRDNSGNAFAANYVYVLEFDANAYATADREGGRTDYWHFLDQSGNMEPGKLYMIWFRNAQTAVEFHKKAGETIWNTTTSVSTTGGSSAQDNWNAIANPALFHASLNTGAEDVLRYNGNDSYIAGSTANMIVGEPVFVQVATEKPVVTAQTGGASPAPYHRAPETATEADNRFVVELSLAGQLNDRMIVQTADEKANEYVIGKDLAKMSLSSQNAQMWINRYDAKLCKNTVALQGEQVEYPLNISAPQAGGYVLSAVQERGDATLYLTYNGEAIWNLSEGDYVISLNQGTDANYGLRISVKNAPQTTTGMDEAVVDAQGETKKVLIDNQVFIIRGDKVYSIDGQLVK
ncbi:MAG: hypothetical protein IKM83_03225 [Paludibacteraceae bacterium]|nr:hypothetical protein [Paludibacteraceae bacterium]